MSNLSRSAGGFFTYHLFVRAVLAARLGGTQAGIFATTVDLCRVLVDARILQDIRYHVHELRLRVPFGHVLHTQHDPVRGLHDPCLPDEAVVVLDCEFSSCRCLPPPVSNNFQQYYINPVAYGTVQLEAIIVNITHHLHPFSFRRDSRERVYAHQRTLHPYINTDNANEEVKSSSHATATLSSLGTPLASINIRKSSSCSSTTIAHQ